MAVVEAAALGMLVEVLVVQAEVETQTVVLLQQILVVEAEAVVLGVLVEMELLALLLCVIQTLSMLLYPLQAHQQ